MAKAGPLTAQDIERLKEDLKSAPPPPRKLDLTKIEAVQLLMPEIERLQSEKYTLQGIAEFLTARGLPINSTTLSSYMAELRSRAKPARKPGAQAAGKARESRGASPAAAPASAPAPVPPQHAAHGASKATTKDAPKPVPSANEVHTPSPTGAPARGTFVVPKDTPNL